MEAIVYLFPHKSTWYCTDIEFVNLKKFNVHLILYVIIDFNLSFPVWTHFSASFFLSSIVSNMLSPNVPVTVDKDKIMLY